MISHKKVNTKTFNKGVKTLKENDEDYTFSYFIIIRSCIKADHNIFEWLSVTQLNRILINWFTLPTDQSCEYHSGISNTSATFAFAAVRFSLTVAW